MPDNDIAPKSFLIKHNCVVRTGNSPVHATGEVGFLQWFTVHCTLSIDVAVCEETIVLTIKLPVAATNHAQDAQSKIIRGRWEYLDFQSNRRGQGLKCQSCRFAAFHGATPGVFLRPIWRDNGSS